MVTLPPQTKKSYIVNNTKQIPEEQVILSSKQPPIAHKNAFCLHIRTGQVLGDTAFNHQRNTLRIFLELSLFYLLGHFCRSCPASSCCFLFGFAFPQSRAFRTVVSCASCPVFETALVACLKVFPLVWHLLRRCICA